jgi:hypothetical protein
MIKALAEEEYSRESGARIDRFTLFLNNALIPHKLRDEDMKYGGF